MASEEVRDPCTEKEGILGGLPCHRVRPFCAGVSPVFVSLRRCIKAQPVTLMLEIKKKIRFCTSNQNNSQKKKNKQKLYE